MHQAWRLNRLPLTARLATVFSVFWSDPRLLSNSFEEIFFLALSCFLAWSCLPERFLNFWKPDLANNQVTGNACHYRRQNAINECQPHSPVNTSEKIPQTPPHASVTRTYAPTIHVVIHTQALLHSLYYTGVHSSQVPHHSSSSRHYEEEETRGQIQGLRWREQRIGGSGIKVSAMIPWLQKLGGEKMKTSEL